MLAKHRIVSKSYCTIIVVAKSIAIIVCIFGQIMLVSACH